MRLRLRMAGVVLSHYRYPLLSFRILRRLAAHRREISGEKIRKMVRVDGRYYWDLYVPGYGSPALNGFFYGEAARLSPGGKPAPRFNNVMVAMTKKCPLRCEHCFEWDALNKPATLTAADFREIIRKMQQRGTGQIQLSGGEPLMEMDLLLDLLTHADPGTDFWLFTSGFGLSQENATKLKNAGLTGVIVSLDHHDPDWHNRFRGSAEAYDWVIRAVKNAADVKLVTALSLCATPGFISETNLHHYALLAKEMGVGFIQVLEPRATGHYRGRDLTLSPGQLQLLADFFLRMNSDPAYLDFPIVCYHGYYQRKVGCFGSADRSVYIDTDGDLHACPFCRRKSGNTLGEDLERSIETLRMSGCSHFGKAILSEV